MDTKTCISATFNKPSQKLAHAIVARTKELEEYWPLTVRQVFYQMVAHQVVENKQEQYRKVSRVLVKLREMELVPWGAIADRTWRTTDKRGVSDVQEFLGNEIKALFNPKNYGRCYVQGQHVHVEVTTEKDALSSIMEEALWPFCVRLNVIRGQNSATMNHLISERLADAGMKGKNPVLLHFGDLDASGVAIPKAIKRILWERHHVAADVRTIALTPDQVDQYNLPTSIEARKPKDPNYRAWLDEHGPAQPMVELDALHPKDLQEILTAGLLEVFDMERFDEERQNELEDRQLLKKIRRDVLDFLAQEHPEHFDCDLHIR